MMASDANPAENVMPDIAPPSEGPTIVFFGHFGAGNWGNECTLLACLKNVRRLQPGAHVVCLSSKPQDTFERYGEPVAGLLDLRRDMYDVRDKKRSRVVRLIQLVAAQPINFVAMLRILRKSDAVVMTGTGMITDWGEGPLGLPLSMWQWSAMASALGCRVIFLSVGVERIEHPTSRHLLRRALRLADYRSFRDDHSRSQLVTAGIPVAEDPIYPDLAFSLPIPVDLRTGRKTGSVAVGVFCHRSRGAASAEDLAEYRSYIEKLGRFVLLLLARKKSVRLIIGDISDVAVIEDLKAWLAPHNPPAIESEPAASVEEVLQQLAGAEFVVATRFHNVLLALHLGIPVLSIAYEGKNDSLMREAGLDDFCQSIDSLDVEKLFDQFCKLEAQSAQIVSQLTLRKEKFQKQLDEQYVKLFGMNGLVNQDARKKIRPWR